MNNYKLIKYTNDFYEFVYEVKKNAYIKYVEQIWGPWNEEDQRKYFENFINTYKDSSYIIELNGEHIGFYNDELLEDNTYEIGNICIIPSYQGKGIGTQILKDILDKNKDKDIIIQYFKQNPVGKLYERLGFKPYKEKDYHYVMIKAKE